MKPNRAFALTWRFPALIRFSVPCALLALACSDTSGTGDGSGSNGASTSGVSPATASVSVGGAPTAGATASGSPATGGTAASSPSTTGGTTTTGSMITGGVTTSGGATATDGSAPTGATMGGAATIGTGTAAGGAGTTTTGGSGAGGAGGTATGGTGTATGGTGGTATDVVESAGCGKTPTLTNGTHSIQSSGQNRSYMITIPEDYDNNHPYWLILGYHWLGGNANEVDGGGSCGYSSTHYGLRALSEQSTIPAIFVAPDGLNAGWGNSNNQDVIFTDDMIEQISEDLCVDTKHIFAHGFSYGGGMSKALACQRPDVFRAVAVYAGADFLSGGCDDGTTSPVAFFGAHSINDGTNSYASGEAIRDRFVANNGCTPQDPPEPGQNDLTHICTSYQGCMEGYPVEWCAFNGGGHTPAAVDGSTGCCNCENQWVPPAVWSFFTQF